MDQIPFAPLELNIWKAVENSHGVNGIIDVEIGGRISDQGLDMEQEKIIQKGIDFDTYFLKGGLGRIKYGHSQGPEFNIGFPEAVDVKAGETLFKGRLFALPDSENYKMTKKAFDDIRNIVAYNNAHPGNQRKIGWSLEGGKLAKSGMDVQKSLVTHVVLTPNPVNPRTSVDLYKSFMAANQIVNPANLVGSYAGRKENLEGSKFHELNRELDKVSSKEEAQELYKSFGYNDQEASYLAEMWEADKNLNKSYEDRVDAQVQKITVALEKYPTLIKSLEETSVETMAKSFTEAQRADTEGNINAVNLIKESTNFMIELHKSFRNELVELFKGNQAILEAMKEDADLKKSLLGKISNISKEIAYTRENQNELQKSFRRFDGGISSDSLEMEDILESSDPTGGSGGSTEDPNANKNAGKASREQVRDFYLAKSSEASEKGDMNLLKDINKKLSIANEVRWDITALPEAEQREILKFYKEG